MGTMIHLSVVYFPENGNGYFCRRGWRIRKRIHVYRKKKSPAEAGVEERADYFSVMFLATWTPLAEAWDREWVMPLPSPMM